MTFWRGWTTVACKEFRHLRHDPGTLFLSLGTPLLAFLLFGYALDTRVHDVPTTVQNLDTGRYSRELVADVFHSPVFRYSGTSGSEEDLLSGLRRGRAKVAIQIPSGYSKDVFYGRPTHVRVWVDGSDSVLASQAVSAAQAIGFKHAIHMTVAGTTFDPGRLEWKPDVLYNPDSKPAHFFLPALCALLGESTTLLLVALSIAKELERGTLDQLRITFIPVWSLIAGKLAACSALGLTVAFTLATLMHFVFGVPIAGSVPLLCLSLLAIQCPILGIGLILTAEARNQEQALQFNFLVFLPGMLISGFAFPRETMAPLVSFISSFLPATWSIQILRAIVLRGATFTDLTQQFLTLGILTVVCVTAGVWRV